MSWQSFADIAWNLGTLVAFCFAGFEHGISMSNARKEAFSMIQSSRPLIAVFLIGIGFVSSLAYGKDFFVDVEKYRQPNAEYHRVLSPRSGTTGNDTIILRARTAGPLLPDASARFPQSGGALCQILKIEVKGPPPTDPKQVADYWVYVRANKDPKCTADDPECKWGYCEISLRADEWFYIPRNFYYGWGEVEKHEHLNPAWE